MEYAPSLAGTNEDTLIAIPVDRGGKKIVKLAQLCLLENADLAVARVIARAMSLGIDEPTATIEPLNWVVISRDNPAIAYNPDWLDIVGWIEFAIARGIDRTHVREEYFLGVLRQRVSLKLWNARIGELLEAETDLV